MLIGTAENLTVPLTIESSKLGGIPLYPCKPAIPKCQKCFKDAKYLMQIYAPDDFIEMAYHKWIYVYICDLCNLFYSFRIGMRSGVVLEEAISQCSFGGFPEFEIISTQIEDDDDNEVDADEDEDKFSTEASDGDAEDDVKDKLAVLYSLFETTLSKNPRQVLRYLRYESSSVPPLLPANQVIPSNQSSFSCKNCQTPLTLELQLTPQIIHFCKLNCDWSTILLYSCPSECNPNEFNENLAVKI